MENKAHIDGNGNIVIQGVDGSTITINPENTDQIRDLIIELGTKLKELPKDILKMIEENQDIQTESTKGANLYLTTLAELHEFQGARKIKFGLTITNLTKQHRYFNQPFFKVTPKFEIKKGLEHDTFIIIPENNNQFPVRLEYGQPASYDYKITDDAFDMYKQLLEKDEEANIQAFSNTTVGELYESNTFSLKKLFENLEWLIQ